MEYRSDVTKSDHRIPVISDPGELNIPWRTLQTIIAGRSLIDVFELNFSDLDEAQESGNDSSKGLHFWQGIEPGTSSFLLL
jgi:hypothetical protein